MLGHQGERQEGREAGQEGSFIFEISALVLSFPSPSFFVHR